MNWQEGQRKISSILIFTMLFSLLMPVFAFGAASPSFNDIGSSYATQEIQALADQGVLSGYEDGSFRPAQAISRAELAKLLSLSLELKEDAEQAASFSDVAADAWYRGYVGALVASGITQGTSETAFSPDAKVTREELVVFFIRALGVEKEALQASLGEGLSDLKDVSGWAQPHVSLAYRIGLVNGIEGPNGVLVFKPKANAERQALARLAYEFKMGKAKFVSKAKELVRYNEPAVVSVTVVSQTTIEVTFNQEVSAAVAADFVFDQGLKVTKAELKSGSKTVIVLTTSSQTSGTVYKLLYKGKDTGKTFKGASAILGGGGSGSGVSGGAKSDLDKLNSGGEYENLTIRTSGELGPKDGAAKTVVTGTLTLDPGPTGEITLRNVKAQRIVVASGSSNSIKLQNTIIQSLRVAANNQIEPVRIESLSGSQVTQTDVQSKVIMESTAGSLGMIKVGSGAAGQEIELRGTLQGGITVEGQGAQIKLAPPKEGGATTVASLNLGTNATVSIAEGTTLSQVNITASNAKINLAGEGLVDAVTVSKEAQGATLNLTNSQIRSIKVEANIKLEGTTAAIGAVKIVPAEGVVVEASDELIQGLKAIAIAAIAEIAKKLPLTEYKEDLDDSISKAEIVASNAILLGVKVADLVGYMDTLQPAVKKITELALETAARSLSIGFADGDSKEAVKHSVKLRTSDAFTKVSIFWSSANPSVVTADGTVIRPAAGEADASVVLTAILSRSGEQRSIDWTITVLARSATPNQPEMTGLSINPSNVTFTVYGEQRSLVVKAVYSNGEARDVTGYAQYTSSNPTVVTVNSSGVLTSASEGQAVVTATYGDFQAISQVTVDGLGVKAETDDGQVALSWNDVGANVTYQVYSSEMSGVYTALPKTVPGVTYTAYGLDSGKTYYFTVKAIQGNKILKVSQEVSAVPRLAQKTDVPTVTGIVYSYGWRLEGTSEPYANLKLTRDDASKTYIDNHGVGSEGRYRLSKDYYSNGSFEVGERILLTAQVSGKRESDPVVLVVKPTSGTTAKPTVSGDVYDTGDFYGYAEPGATVIVTKGTDRPHDTKASHQDGLFSLHSGYYSAGTVLRLTAIEFGKSVSEIVYLTVKQALPIQQPTVIGAVYTNGWKLSGTAEPYATITLSKKNGGVLAKGNAAEDGYFSLTDLLWDQSAQLKEGEQIVLVTEAYGKKKSDPLTFTVQPITIQTARVMLDVVNEVLVKGWAEFGSTVAIQVGKNKKTYYLTASKGNGAFILELQDGVLAAGDKLTLTVHVPGQQASLPVETVVETAPISETPVVTGSVYTNAIRLYVKSEPGTRDRLSYVSIRRSNGAIVAQHLIWQDGSLLIQTLPNYPLQAGEELLVSARAYGKKESAPVKLKVQATEDVTAEPEVFEITEVEIQGKAEPNSIIVIKGAQGQTTPLEASAFDGSFGYNMLNWAGWKVGDRLEVTSTTIGKATSKPVYVAVKSAHVTATPVVTGVVYTNAFDLMGIVPQESGHVAISLSRSGYPYIYGTGATGSIFFRLYGFVNTDYVKLTAGQELWVTAQAGGKKISEPFKLTVQATQGQTAVPTISDYDFESYRYVGKAEPGALVRLRNDSINTDREVEAKADGTYEILYEPNDLRVGDQLTLTATVLGKSISDPVHISLVRK